MSLHNEFSGHDSQLWTLQPLVPPLSWFYIQTALKPESGELPLVIDIKSQDWTEPTSPSGISGSGTPLQAYEIKGAADGLNDDYQSCAFYPGPSGYYYIGSYINGSLVIDIKGGSRVRCAAPNL